MSEDSNGFGHSLWGGRFSAKPGEVMQAINASIGFDKRLAAEDLAGSRAHAAMLAKAGIISPEDGTTIQGGLDQIEKEIAAGAFTFRDDLEDIHMNIEARLTALVGPGRGGAFIRPAPVTIRWRWMCVFGHGAPATPPFVACEDCSARCSTKPLRTRRI